MDEETLAMAKAYSDSKGGYTTPGAVLTFDGKPNPDAIIDGTMVKLFEEVYDINSIERITVNRNGDKVVYDKTALVVEHGMAIGTADETFVAIVPDAETADFIGLEIGVYFAYEGDSYYTEKVEFDETIHTIDPKYLPGVCLPKEIDLVNYQAGPTVADTLNFIIISLAGAGGGTYTGETATGLWDDVSVENPLVIKLSTLGTDSVNIFVYEPTIVRHHDSGTVLQVCFSALMYHLQMGLLDIKVNINRDLTTNGAAINVKVN